MERRITLIAGIFLLFSFLIVNVQGDGGAILQPIHTPAPEQTYEKLETVELWLVHSPENIQNREVKAVIDGKEITLNLKNITFCEIWQTYAEIWAANISLSNGEHTCQYFYIQSVKQDNSFWADFQVQTTHPFKFYIIGQEHQTPADGTAKNENLTEEFATPCLDIKTFGVCLLLAVGLGACIIKARGKWANQRKNQRYKTGLNYTKLRA